MYRHKCGLEERLNCSDPTSHGMWPPSPCDHGRKVLPWSYDSGVVDSNISSQLQHASCFSSSPYRPACCLPRQHRLTGKPWRLAKARDNNKGANCAQVSRSLRDLNLFLTAGLELVLRSCSITFHGNKPAKRACPYFQTQVILRSQTDVEPNGASW